MSRPITKNKVLLSLFWKFMESGGTQGINFLVTIILARLLMPEDYGIIAIITVFITLANVFIEGGFTTALIQKKDADETDFSTVFYLTIFVAGVFYSVLYFTAPLVAKFYKQTQLIEILKVVSVTLFFGALNSIQTSIISIKMQFKKLFYSSVGAILISGVIGIALAYIGAGVWALVGQQLSNKLFSTIILWFTVRWRPRLLFSVKRLRGLFSYGWKISAASLIGTLYLNLQSLIIGKIYSPEILGYYNRGMQFPSLIVSNINGPIQSVMLPTYSSHQDDTRRLKAMVRRSIVTSSFVVFPIMVGLAVIGEPLIKIVLSEKWLPCVTFLQIYCAAYALMPIHIANLQAIKALGYSGTILKLEIIKNIMGLAILFVTVLYGVYAIALGVVITGLISTLINSYPNKTLLNYGYKEQWKDIMPSLLLSLLMGGVVYVIQFIGLASWLTLIIQICIGVGLYVVLAQFFKLECFYYLINTCKEISKSKKREKLFPG